MRRIGIGVIGCGLMGRELGSAAGRWMHLLDQKVAPKIVAACDVNPAARAWFVANAGPLAVDTADAADVFRCPEVEAVYIAVPHDLHADLYVAAIRAGK
ncbi:MAG: Gfo/Idh/MocA family oxidoreductase, partial [bacterium]